jgi:hypothetical protein
MAEDDSGERPADQPGGTDGSDDRVVRTVESLDGKGHVALPSEWVGARVEVVRTGPGEPDRTGYTLADADDEPAFAACEGDQRWAGPDVVDHLERGADDPARLYVGLADDEAGTYHAAVQRDDLAGGLLVLGDDDRTPALLSNLAWQGVAGGAPGAVLARSGPAAEWFARSLPDGRSGDLQVLGGPDRRSVNLLDPGVPPSSAAYFDAVDAVTDALVSLLVVVDPQLRDAVREFVMAASSTHADTSLVELRELVRSGVDEDADVPAWVPEKSPDLLDRVAGVDAEAVEWLLDSMAPLLSGPVRSLLADPDPDIALVEVVRSRAPLVVQVGAEYGADTYRTVARAVVHGLWGAAREFVPDAADHPLYLVGDEFGPVLAAEDDVDRLFARMHRDRVVAAFGVRDAAVLDADHWDGVAAEAGVHVAFPPADPAARERATVLDGIDADRLGELAAGQFWLGGVGDPRRHLGYHPVPPRRPPDSLDWLE